MDEPKCALHLWNQGFRPIYARDVEPGMTIAYYETLLDYPTHDDPRVTRVTEVLQDFGTIYIHAVGVPHGACDELAEVWVK